MFNFTNMKVKNIISGIAIVAILFTVTTLAAQSPTGGEPGIVMSASNTFSQIPSKAKSFINKHFKGVGVRTCERFFAKGKYEVELSNGIDLEFDNDGNITEIDAAGHTTLPVSVVKDILHHKAFSRLQNNNLADKVESIEFNRNKVCSVELQIPDPDTYLFDVNGVFIAIED